MTIISIKEKLNFEQNEFDTLEEFQLYLLLQQENSQLSDAHKTILETRINEANLANEPSSSWEVVKANLKRRNE
jgi:hypothetical protein